MDNPYASVYGLTGVIGSGKSTAAAAFRELGAEVLDADELARYVIDPASPYYGDLRNKITATFGGLITDMDVQSLRATGGGSGRKPPDPLFSPEGKLNRTLLARVAFGDPAKVEALNRIMHPAIQQEFALRVGRAGAAKVIIYDVPLLFEGGLNKLVKGTIVVYAPEQVCVARAVARAAAKGEHLTADAVLARLRSQISIEEKRARADYIIDNSGDPAALKGQVAGVYQKLASL